MAYFKKEKKGVRMKKMMVVIAGALVAVGCGSRDPVWVERHVPTTDDERRAVAEMVEKVLAATPGSLGGHDQDWDDAIEEAKDSAMETLCRPTYWERAPIGFAAEMWDYTGRWRYASGTNQVNAGL
jgi:hypothetical protein